MNNSEWMKLLRKQREREEIARKNEEVENNESVVNNGDGNNSGQNASNETGGAGADNSQHTELGDIDGDREAGQTDNGNIE